MKITLTDPAVAYLDETLTTTKKFDMCFYKALHWICGCLIVNYIVCPSVRSYVFAHFLFLLRYLSALRKISKALYKGSISSKENTYSFFAVEYCLVLGSCFR